MSACRNSIDFGLNFAFNPQIYSNNDNLCKIFIVGLCFYLLLIEIDDCSPEDLPSLKSTTDQNLNLKRKIVIFQTDF